jgi:hypothetical protein
MIYFRQVVTDWSGYDRSDNQNQATIDGFELKGSKLGQSLDLSEQYNLGWKLAPLGLIFFLIR